MMQTGYNPLYLSYSSNIVTTVNKNYQAALLHARLHDPFCYLGLHKERGCHVVRVFRPHDLNAWLKTANGFEPMHRIHDEGLFEWHGDIAPEQPCRLRLEENNPAPHCKVYETYDPYAFPPQISDHDLYLFHEGKLQQAYRMLGAQAVTHHDVQGMRFAVWAPNAERVSVVGDFNRWDGRMHPMKVHPASGVWELFIPQLPPGSLYKFEIRNRANGEILLKTDPYANHYELRPHTAALTPVANAYHWQDETWVASRSHWDWLHAPLNILEVHVGSWKRHADGRFYNYRELAGHLLQGSVVM